MRRRLGKVGLMLKTFARDDNVTPVRSFDARRGDVERLTKSYGNGLTAPSMTCAGVRQRACVVRGVELLDDSLRSLGIKADNIVYPESFFH